MKITGNVTYIKIEIDTGIIYVKKLLKTRKCNINIEEKKVY